MLSKIFSSKPKAIAQGLHRLWVALMIISGGIALWFSGVAGLEFWKYVRLNTLTPAVISNWEILDLSSSRFAVRANYEYAVKGTAYQGSTVFAHPQFLNRYAAENYVKHVEPKRWSVWYSENSPKVSNLEKAFPQKNCLQALLTVGVFAYFYFARSLLSRFI